MHSHQTTCPRGSEELNLKGDGFPGVAVEKYVLPSDDKRIVRRDAIPHQAWSVGFVEQFPVRLRHNTERRHERSKPVVCGYRTISFRDKWDNLAKRIYSQTFHIVCADLEHPVGHCDIHPVNRRAVLQPVDADDGVGRRGEVDPLARPDAGHHEAALEVLGGQHPCRVRRGYRVLDRIDRITLPHKSCQSCKSCLRKNVSLLHLRQGLIQVWRHVVRSASDLCAACSVERCGHQSEHYDAGKRQLLREAGYRPKRANASRMCRNADPRDKTRRSRQNNRRSPYLRQHGVTSGLWRACGSRCRRGTTRPEGRRLAASPWRDSIHGRRETPARDAKARRSTRRPRS